MKNSLFLSRTFVLIIKPTNPLLPPTTARSLLHPTNVAYGLNLSKPIHYTHAPLVYYYMCRKKYLSICRNPLFIHNISLPNQYTSANSDFPADFNYLIRCVIVTYVLLGISVVNSHATSAYECELLAVTWHYLPSVRLDNARSVIRL